MAEVEVQLERLTSPEVRERIASGWKTVVFGCGSIEQHGPHLPLFVDSEFGTWLALEVAQRLDRALIAPTIRVGCSEHHMNFPGSLTLRKETFHDVVIDYVSSLARHGFERILIIPCHGGNFKPLQEVEGRLQEAAGEARGQIWADLMGLVRLWRNVTEEAVGLGDRVGGHADISETAIMMARHPDVVRTGLAEPGYTGDLSREVIDSAIRNGLETVTPNGILGDARGGTPELGKKLIAAVADEIVNHFGEN